MFRYFIKANRTFPKIEMFKNNTYLGSSVYGVSNNNSVIHNLFLEKKYRKNGYGNILLEKTENVILNENPNVNRIILNAYENSNGNLINFYKSAGYKVNLNSRETIYFNGLDTITITNMYKSL